MEKTCFKCGLSKSLDEFYRHPQMSDGRLNKCKDCTRKDVQTNRKARLNHYTAYERKRRPRKMKQVKVLTAEEHALRRWARGKVNDATRRGKLEKQPCEVCGSTYNVQAHHSDYNRPLDIHWLCTKHHAELHDSNALTWQPL